MYYKSESNERWIENRLAKKRDEEKNTAEREPTEENVVRSRHQDRSCRLLLSSLQLLDICFELLFLFHQTISNKQKSDSIRSSNTSSTLIAATTIAVL